MFICGTGNFNHDEDADSTTVPASKRSKRTASFCRILGKYGNANKNPYADRGLDKFYALLADLDDKKQKIYTRLGSEDISFVRFVYASDESNHVKPIVVKVKEKNRQKVNRSEEIAIATKEKETVVPERKTEEEEVEKKSNKKKRYYVKCCNGSCCSVSLDGLRRRPYWYFVGTVVLIMVLLAIFGRSFAILCTSIGWYLVPTVAGETCSSSSSSSSPAERKPKRKQESVKKLTSEDLSSPTSGLLNNRKVQKLQHRHGKKLQKLSTL